MFGIKTYLRIQWKRYFGRPSCIYDDISDYFKGKTGLEIGGPSQIFGRYGLLPIYPIAKILDECNFSENTIWEKQATIKFEKNINKKEVDKFYFHNSKFICEGSHLEDVDSDTYDFLLASHVLEHIANPIGALNEWRRVIKTYGKLLIILPQKNNTFDHKRQLTSFSHLYADYQNHVPESDLTHLDEILKYHDFKKDRGIKTVAEFRSLAEHNINYRILHHHVFDLSLIIQMLGQLKMEILAFAIERPFHIIVLSQKINEDKYLGIGKQLTINKIKSNLGFGSKYSVKK